MAKIKKKPSEEAQQLMTYIGGYVSLLPNGITWYWGNVSIYIYSYFHHKNQSAKTIAHQDVKAPWLLSMYVISMSTAVMVSGYINNKIGRRPTLLLGVVLFDGGLMASYFVFSNSMSMLDLTMGLLCGFGNGLLHSMILQTIVEWTTKHLGLVTAFLLTSYAIGSVITNQVITHYLNPENKKVDIIIGKAHFFSQEDILEKVPSMFLALATTCAVFHAVGFLLIRLKQMTPNKKLKDNKQDLINNKSRKESLRLPKKLLSRSDPNLTAIGKIHDSNYQYDSLNSPSEWLANSENGDDVRPRSVSFSDNHSVQINANNNDDDNDNEVDKSPRQVLRSSFFYVIWFIVFGADSAFMTLSNYYKVFGQVWIKDDHFLTNLGTTFAVFTVAMRLVWGFLTDFMGLKPALVTFTSGLALISTLYVFTASINKWLFFLVTVLFGCLNCGVYVNFIVAMHSMYGKVNFTKNYGLLASATIILNIVFPPLTKLLLSHFGWFGLFFFIGTLNCCSLILVVCTLAD